MMSAGKFLLLASVAVPLVVRLIVEVFQRIWANNILSSRQQTVPKTAEDRDPVMRWALHLQRLRRRLRSPENWRRGPY
jgi:hypothetical protein